MKTNSKWLLQTIRVVLNIMWYANIILAVFAFCMLTWKFSTSNFTEFSTPVKYPLQPQLTPVESLTPYADHITLQADQAIIKMQLQNTFGNIATAYFFFLAFEGLVMVIIYHLRKFFSTVKQNLPFKYDNVHRLKIIALCFVLLTVLNILLGVSTAYILREHVKAMNTMNMVWSKSFIGLILGVVIYIMADIFRYGFELKKENGEFV